MQKDFYVDESEPKGGMAAVQPWYQVTLSIAQAQIECSHTNPFPRNSQPTDNRIWSLFLSAPLCTGLRESTAGPYLEIVTPYLQATMPKLEPERLS
jgi:hypothetical protein